MSIFDILSAWVCCGVVAVTWRTLQDPAFLDETWKKLRQHLSAPMVLVLLLMVNAFLIFIWPIVALRVHQEIWHKNGV